MKNENWLWQWHDGDKVHREIFQAKNSRQAHKKAVRLNKKHAGGTPCMSVCQYIGKLN